MGPHSSLVDYLAPRTQGVVSSTFLIVQIILVHSHFELVSSVLALDATDLVSEPISEPVTQMAVELINNHLILVQQKR